MVIHDEIDKACFIRIYKTKQNKKSTLNKLKINVSALGKGLGVERRDKK